MRTKFFNFISHLVYRHPWKVVIAAGLLAVIALGYAVATVRLNANLDDLVSDKLDYHKRYIDFLKEFGDEEYLYVVVDASADLPRAKEFVEKLGTRIKTIPNIRQVLWKIENPVLEKSFLLYLKPEQIKALDSMMTAGPFAIRNIATWDNFAQMFAAMADRIRGPVSVTDENELKTGFTFIDGLLDDMTAALEKGAPYQSRLQSLFFGGEETFDPDGFMKNGSLLFMLIMPSKDFSTMEVISEPLKDIRAEIAKMKTEMPGIDAGLTGRPVLSADEMATSNADTNWATAAALIIEAILLIFFFKSVSRPILAVGSLIIGIAWTFGLVAVVYGTLNILSMVFAIILASTAIEYAIQILARYQETVSHTGKIRESINASLTKTGPAVLTSAVTTAAAFCTITWTKFSALVQLGVIAASGIILCLIAILVVLPALIVLRDRRLEPTKLREVHPFHLPHIEKIYRRPKFVFGVSMLVTAVLAFFAFRTGFDNNLLNLQAKGLESVKYEHLILEKSTETTWFARAVADTNDESHRKALEFSALPSVRKVDDVERILPENQKAGIKLVHEMAPAFEGLKFNAVSGNTNPRMLMFELGRMASYLERLEEQAFTSGRTDAVEELGKFVGKMRGLVKLIDAADEKRLGNLGLLQKDFFSDLHKNLEILAAGMRPKQIVLKDLPEDVAARFVSPTTGRYSLYIYPKENIWDPAALERFVNDIRSVDPNVVGTPIEVHESGRLMRDTLKRSALLAFFLICFLVWMDFRSLRCVFLSVLPLVVGTIWLLGVMGIFDIPFNMANFFAIPILIGIGVDFGVNVTHRIRHDRSFMAISTSMGKGVLLTALANAVGFGTMIFARHQGIASLGKVMAIGCIFCFLASVIPMPPVAKWMNWGRGQGIRDKG